jgi:outer membrane lipoprotein SlyB
MNTQANERRHLPLLIGGVFVFLISGIAIGSLAISAQGFDGIRAPSEPPDAAAVPAIAAPEARAYRCAECGIIESLREIVAPGEEAEANVPGRIVSGKRGETEAKRSAIETKRSAIEATRSAIEAKRVRNYEVTIRLQDGSTRVITEAAPARWRQRERVTIIAGVD